MTKYNWVFEEHHEETSTIVGFVHNAIQNFAKNPIQSIVREGIQNSTDAIAEEKSQVKVVIKTGFLSKDEIPNLSKVEQHLRACKDKSKNAASENEEIQRHLNFLDKQGLFYPFIEVSDYNTKGMDPKSFLYFTQGDFKSHKDDPGSQGSKGVGKAAYFACSALRTMIISSKTKDGFQFRGTARLSTHKNPENPEQYLKNQGYFGTTDWVENEDVPERFRRQEIGTSIFVIGAWHTEDGFKDKVIAEVLRNYWFAIATDQLIVDVENEIVNKSNLEYLIEKCFPDYRDYRTGEKQNPRPYFESFKKGNIYKRYIRNIGECKLWLHRNQEFNLGAVARFRKTKMLIYKENNLDPGYAGVFLCEDKDGNKFLKDIENEAHDEWNPKINPEYQKEAQKTLKEINDFITDSYYKYAGVGQSDSFSLDSLNDIFGFTDSKSGDKKEEKSDSTPKPEPTEGSEPQDRIISKQIINYHLKDGKYLYTIEFDAARAIKQHKIKLSIATESSRDSIEIFDVPGHVFADDVITLNINEGLNKIENIEFDTPYLVAPIISSLK